MPTLKFRLHAERQELVEEQQRILAQQGALSAADTLRDDEIDGRIKEIDKELLTVLEREEERKGENYARFMKRPDAKLPPTGDIYPASVPSVSAGAKGFVEKLFGNQALSMDGWRDSEEFYQKIHMGSGDERFKMSATMMEQADPSGGFATPTQLAAGLLGAAYEESIVLPRATVEPMTSSTKLTWSFDPSTAANGQLYGGVTPKWTVETGTMTAEDAVMFQQRLEAKKLTAYAQSSNELLADGLSFREQVEAMLIKAIAWSLDDAFFNGSGVGEPLGILNCDAKIEVAAEGSQTADTLKYANLAKMFARMHPSLIRNAVWVANPACLPELLGITIGANNAFYPVLSESNGQLRILSLPLILTEKVPTLGDAGDISLIAFSEYVVGLRREISLDRSQHVGFASDLMTWRCQVRADGSSRWKSSYQPKNGSTLSPFVTLAARA